MRLAALPFVDKTPVRPVPAVHRRSRPMAGVPGQAGRIGDDTTTRTTASGSDAGRFVAASSATGLVGRPLSTATAFGLHRMAEEMDGSIGGIVVTSSMRAAGAYRQVQQASPAFPYARAAEILSTVA